MLREDSLALFMHYANVVPGSNVLVLDDCYGLLLAAVMYRSDPSTTINVVYADYQKPSMSKFRCLEFLNIPSERRDAIKLISLKSLVESQADPKNKYTQ
jgi:hypothetical protein